MKNILLVLLTLCIVNPIFSQNNCTQPVSNCPSCCTYSKDCSFNCHQYVRGCILGMVDLDTRIPDSDYALCGLSSHNIKSSSDFIQVCSASQSDAASLVTIDHSAYRNGNDYSYLGTPNGTSQMLCEGHPVYSMCLAGTESYNHYAYIDDVNVNGQSTLSVGNTYTYTLSNLPSGVTIDYVYVNSTYATVTQTLSTSFKITAQSATNSTQVKVYLKSNCSSSQTRYRSRNITITGGSSNQCTGTLNNGPLYTFNNVSNTSNTVSMNSSFWNWQITSGYASYYTTGNGQNLHFTLYNGCVSFYTYNGGCQGRTYTFCKSYYRKAAVESEEVTIEVYDIRSGRRMKSFDCYRCDQSNIQITEDLPFGLYAIIRNGKVEKHMKYF